MGVERVFHLKTRQKMNEVKEIILTQSVEVIHIPSGQPATLPQDERVILTQSLGNSFTVQWSGNLYRVGGENAEALGMPKIDVVADIMAEEDTVEGQVEAVLNTVYDPEIPVSIKALGLIYRCEIDQAHVDIDMTLTAPGCGMGPVMVEEMKQRLLRLSQIQTVAVQLVFDPPWNQSMMSQQARLQLGVF